MARSKRGLIIIGGLGAAAAALALFAGGDATAAPSPSPSPSPSPPEKKPLPPGEIVPPAPSAPAPSAPAAPKGPAPPAPGKVVVEPLPTLDELLSDGPPSLDQLESILADYPHLREEIRRRFPWFGSSPPEDEEQPPIVPPPWEAVTPGQPQPPSYGGQPVGPGVDVVEEVTRRAPEVIEEVTRGGSLPAPDDVHPVTMAMVAELLQAERGPSWKREFETVRTWQKMRGLTGDAKFGPGSARLLALETGLLPIVRYWPKGTHAHIEVPKYRAAIETLALEAESPRREHLLAAIDREQGQAYGTPPAPITTQIVYEAATT